MAAGVPRLQAIREAYLPVGDSVPIMADGGEITLAAMREIVLPDPTAFLVPRSAAARIESYER
jgi:hypothetical protein